MTVSVVIPNYDGERLLPSCLAALRAQTVAPAEVIVVDNASRDRSLELLRREHPDVRVLAQRRNLGFAGGANRGIEAATGELVAVLNSDARPARDWLERLLAAPGGHDVWAWGSVLVSADGLVESAGDHYNLPGYASKLLRGRPVSELPELPYDVVAPPGAAPLLRRDRVLELGGYEERFFLYYEDVDLALRALLRGWRAVMVPSARVEHDLGGSGTSARTRFHVARNSLWTAARCLPEPRARAIAHRAVQELRWKRRPARLAAVEVAGRAAGLAGLPWALRTRAAIQAERRLSPAEVRARLAQPELLRREPAAAAPAPTPAAA